MKHGGSDRRKSWDVEGGPLVASSYFFAISSIIFSRVLPGRSTLRYIKLESKNGDEFL